MRQMISHLHAKGMISKDAEDTILVREMFYKLKKLQGTL